MNTIVYQPVEAIRPYVSQIMVMENAGRGNEAFSFPFYADGYPGLIYHQTSGGMYLNNASKGLSAFFVYGQTVNPIELMAYGDYRMIVFYLHPHVLRSLIGIRSNELTDGCLDLSLLHHSRARETLRQLEDSESATDQVSLISSYIHQLAKLNDSHPDHTVQFAVTRLSGAGGKIPISSVLEPLHVTARTFERRFKEHVGVSPKLFARICQFQSTLRQMENNNYFKLSDLAFDNGYADQSHFIRAFREFTGQSPLLFQKSRHEWQEPAYAGSF